MLNKLNTLPIIGRTAKIETPEDIMVDLFAQFAWWGIPAPTTSFSVMQGSLWIDQKCSRRLPYVEYSSEADPAGHSTGWVGYYPDRVALSKAFLAGTFALVHQFENGRWTEVTHQGEFRPFDWDKLSRYDLRTGLRHFMVSMGPFGATHGIMTRVLDSTPHRPRRLKMLWKYIEQGQADIFRRNENG